MSPYEARRWRELESYWAKKAQRRPLTPPNVRAAAATASAKAKDVAVRTGTAIAGSTPEPVKDFGGWFADAALAPTVDGIVRTIELVNDWASELADPEKVLGFHRKKGRDVSSLGDLRDLDLADLDEVVRRLVLQWRSLGAAEGAALGALAMIPVGGGALAITADVVLMQILTTAIATRVCYAYGFDAKEPELQHIVRRMVSRSFGEQAPKAGAARSANLAAQAAKGRQRWSKKLRDDHRILAALEKLMKKWNGVPNVPVGRAAKGLPVIAVVTSTGTNAFVIGDVAKQARYYAQTLFLAEKYGLPLPPALTRFADPDETSGTDDATA
jgi:hypothetical protein